MLIRLNKFIAECGYCSRRKADDLIESKKVYINDKVVINQGQKVDTENDVVRIENYILKQEEKKIYLMLNKPVRIYYYK